MPQLGGSPGRSSSRSSSRPTRSIPSTTAAAITWARATTARTPTGSCTMRWQRAERVGLGRWVFHNREYLVAVEHAPTTSMALHTMRFADELVGADDLDLPRRAASPPPREVKMAGTLVDSLSDELRPRRFEDAYRERVLDLIEVKARGEEPELPEAPEPAGGLTWQPRWRPA